MGETPEAMVGPPDWAREPLQRFAYIDETAGGFTELRVSFMGWPDLPRGTAGPVAAFTSVFPGQPGALDAAAVYQGLS